MYLSSDFCQPDIHYNRHQHSLSLLPDLLVLCVAHFSSKVSDVTPTLWGPGRWGGIYIPQSIKAIWLSYPVYQVSGSHTIAPAMWICTFVRHLWELSYTGLGKHVSYSSIQDRRLSEAKADLQTNAVERNQVSGGTILPCSVSGPRTLICVKETRYRENK